MTNDILSKRKLDDDNKQLILALPAGRVGVHFSKTVPCEICRIDEESPIFDSIYLCLGRIAYHLSIPGKLDIHGALDNKTLETLLSAYSNIPNRKLMFINRDQSSKKGLVTSTVLRQGPVTASFRSSKGFLASRNRVFVSEVGKYNMTYEFPVGHYVQKVIIPNHLVLEGGIRSTARLLQTLDQFADVPGRKIVFQKSPPKGRLISKITLRKGPIGVIFYPADDDILRLPVVSAVAEASKPNAWRLNIAHVVEKLIIPNEITIERMGCRGFEIILNNFSEVDGRVIVLQEFHKDISKGGAAVTLTLPTGDLGLTFKSELNYITVDVNKRSRIKNKVPTGYYVESLFIPGLSELIEVDNTMNPAIFLETLNEFSHIHDRVLVLKQCRRDVKSANIGKQSNAEFV